MGSSQRNAARDVGQLEGDDGGRIEGMTVQWRRKRVNGRGSEE